MGGFRDNELADRKGRGGDFSEDEKLSSKTTRIKTATGQSVVKASTRADITDEVAALLRSLGAGELADEIDRAFAAGKSPFPHATGTGKITRNNYLLEKFPEKGPLNEAIRHIGMLMGQATEGVDDAEQVRIKKSLEGEFQKATEKLASAYAAHKNPEVVSSSDTPTETTGTTGRKVRTGTPEQEFLKKLQTSGAIEKALTGATVDDPRLVEAAKLFGVTPEQLHARINPVAPDTAAAQKKAELEAAAAQQLEGKAATPADKTIKDKAKDIVDDGKKAADNFYQRNKRNPLLQMFWPSEGFEDFKKAGEIEKTLKQRKAMPGKVSDARRAVEAEALIGEDTARVAQESKMLDLMRKPSRVTGKISNLPKALRTSGVTKIAGSLPGGILLGMLLNTGVNKFAELTGAPITPENRMIAAQRELQPNLDELLLNAEIQARQQDRAARALQENPELAAQLAQQARIAEAGRRGRSTHTQIIGGTSEFGSDPQSLLNLMGG